MNTAESAGSLFEGSIGGLDKLGLLSTIEEEKEDAWITRGRELYAFYDLENNWDGEGAEPLSKILIDSAIQYFNNLSSQKQTPPSRVIASQDGEIIIEWQIDDGYIEATISQPYMAEYMYVYPGGLVEHYDVHWESPQSNDLWGSDYTCAA